MKRKKRDLKKKRRVRPGFSDDRKKNVKRKRKAGRLWSIHCPGRFKARQNFLISRP